MGEVNRIPRGFLDLIGAQTQGKNPPVFSDGLSPIIDMTPLYLAQTLGAHKLNFAHTVNAAQASVTVPSDEVWLLLSLGTQAFASTVGEFEQWAFIINDVIRESGAAPTLPQFHVTEVATNIAINQLLATGFTLPSMIVLQGGMKIIAKLVQRDATASRSTALEYLFYRLKG